MWIKCISEQPEHFFAALTSNGIEWLSLAPVSSSAMACSMREFGHEKNPVVCVAKRAKFCVLIPGTCTTDNSNRDKKRKKACSRPGRWHIQPTTRV